MKLITAALIATMSTAAFGDTTKCVDPTLCTRYNDIASRIHHTHPDPTQHATSVVILTVNLTMSHGDVLYAMNQQEQSLPQWMEKQQTTFDAISCEMFSDTIAQGGMTALYMTTSDGVKLPPFFVYEC